MTHNISGVGNGLLLMEPCAIAVCANSFEGEKFHGYIIWNVVCEKFRVYDDMLHASNNYFKFKFS